MIPYQTDVTLADDLPELSADERNAIERALSDRLEKDFARIIGGGPPPKPTALVANSFGGYDIRELDEQGNLIIPKPAPRGFLNLDQTT